MKVSVILALATLSKDNRITVWHIGMYSAFIQLWHSSGCQNPVPITRKKVLELSRIGNIVTYHKCIKELVLYGYIDYKPSYNPYTGSLVYLKTI
ncbi:hypothetical protein DSL64_15915 [Dyadobacter luteus]|uniref:Transcriptional regulator n=1 Tax=Dyadobacter luteus TaxID=2259619 RepID=A0A3D8Y9R4_9BACT|nr:hypothetical protein [Dyadobacter luteus]REA60158.1 hypothetical protein DSL64_15915 [Dyadobacter luteus]